MAFPLFRNRHLNDEDIQEKGEEDLIVGRVSTYIQSDRKKFPECQEYPTSSSYFYYFPQLHASYILSLLEKGVDCPYCRTKLTAKTASLDRILNNKPHHPANVILCCGPCNVARSDNFTFDEFIEVCKLLRQLEESNY